MATKTREETITPAKASLYLEKNSNNRRVRKEKVQKYARDMKSGRWKVTNQAVALNCDGTLLDGQHRLLAIIEAGVPVRMNVTRGMERDAMMGVDVGATRSVSDLANVSGVDVPITASMVATARSMIDSLMDHRGRTASSIYTSEETVKYILKHYEAIYWACSLDLGKASCAPFRAVAARAYYTVDRRKLEEFYNILGTGFFKNECGEWAIKLRDLFISSRGMTGGYAYRRMLYARTERALAKYLEGAPFTRLCEAGIELYPVPSDSAS